MFTQSSGELKMPRMLCICGATLLALWISSGSVAAQQNWTRFRGANGDGISDQKNIPTTWSPGDYNWNIRLPGVGHASPIVWGNKLFITSAVEEGSLRYLFCLNATTGEQIWSRQTGFDKSRKHLKNSWASSTPTTDGERVYVAFADDEHFTLVAYDFDGRLVWRRRLGGFESQHGLGASPIVFEDLIIIPNLQKGPSSIIAVDKRTGRTKWSWVHSFFRTSYATPIIVRLAGEKPQLICASGALGVASLDPYSGRMNWMTGEFPAPRRTVASPVVAGKLVIQTCGGGGRGNVLIAVDLADPDDASKDRIRYKRKKVLPYVPTLISRGEHLYLWNDNGVISCVETTTGKNIWTTRVGGNYSGSPICVDGKIYCISEAGEMVIVPASPAMPQSEDISRNKLGEGSHSTPIVAGGRLYIRTFHRLACLKAR